MQPKSTKQVVQQKWYVVFTCKCAFHEDRDQPPLVCLKFSDNGSCFSVASYRIAADESLSESGLN